ncbi:MAG: RNA polymerase sigma factor [Deltaproteobacteria bacterium]|nr:RNA polymerase sigma factor [Deltaproteobacteria bacterium]
MTKAINDAQQGDMDALNQTLTDIRQNLTIIADSQRVPKRDVEDLVQEASLKIAQNIGTLRNPAAFRTWYGRIAYHEVSSYFRKSNNREVPLDEAIKESVGYVPNMLKKLEAPNMSKQLEEDELFQFLDGLCTTDALRKGLAALKMQVLDGFSLENIAKEMGVKVGTVKSWIHRVVKHLQSKKIVFQQAEFLD